MDMTGAREGVQMAADTLRNNRMRSALTILGVMIGVTTVILLASVITGLTANVNNVIESLGANVFWVVRYPLFGSRPTQEMLARKQLTYDDGMAMKLLPHVVAVDPAQQYRAPSGQLGQFSVKYQGHAVNNTLLEGDSADQPKVYDIRMSQGRFFTEAEERRRADVVVLGYDTAEQLFGNDSALGKQVVIEGDIFTVVGVLEKAKRVFGGGANPDDNAAHFPLFTFRKLHPEVQEYWISVKYDNAKNKLLVESELRDLLRRRRKVRADQPDNFVIFTADSLLQLWNELTSGLFLFLVGVASVGLMVGGVGVMNIMLVSVTERTREIGVRKAVGATRGTILFQFTLEAIALCALGGVAGILAGAVLTWIVRLTLGSILPAQMSLIWAVAAFVVSCGIGLLFGIYPAWKAASLDPIECLRYE